jgi:hypothetical protein
MANPSSLETGSDMPGIVRERFARYPLLDALRGRRSRRFGLGMAIPGGPFTYKSQHPPLSLLEIEEAALAFAACGVTGYALADLSYGLGQGGGMLAGLLGRTISSADAINAVSLVITNDQATYLLKRPQDFTFGEYPDLVRKAAEGDLLELYRTSRIKIKDGRAAPEVKPGYNFNLNRWSLYAPGGSYFLPVNELTALYINALLEAFDETMALFILDERAGFRPAGIARFGRSKGGHLNDDPGAGRFGTIQSLETALVEGIAIEQGMMLQNLGLMAQAIGLGGFPNFAPHPFSWFQELGFTMEQLPTSRYLGANRFLSMALNLMGRDQPFPFPVGLERAGRVHLKPYCPPYYPTMETAVRALVEMKFGPGGVFRGGAALSGWQDPGSAVKDIPGISEAAVAATIAYCEYVYDRYGRFPAYSAPFRTIMGFQATHVDAEFYDRFFRKEALTETQRSHLQDWHSMEPADAKTNIDPDGVLYGTEPDN